MYERSISILQKRYGYTKDEAESQLNKHYSKAGLAETIRIYSRKKEKPNEQKSWFGLDRTKAVIVSIANKTEEKDHHFGYGALCTLLHRGPWRWLTRGRYAIGVSGTISANIMTDIVAHIP